ncbi:uncharacterized protein [Spinacia oleracea]|uniref:Retrotransposon gag domain-containing protein n=1 Tax=Spinacia oleracea TaxID=3562 RepID=A0ABM3RIM6_SPIOL|nr:uncharacterized protein LOC130469950 [Spinacia oleracea]
MNSPKEPKVKIPTIEAYDGTTDPDMHLVAYRHHMFMAHKDERKTSMHLGRIQQGKDESLRSYVKRFNLEARQIPDLPDGVSFDNFIRGLKKGSFKFDLVKKSVRTMAEVLDEAKAFINATEICSASKDGKTEHDNSPGHKKERPQEREYFEYNTDLLTILKDVGTRFDLERPFPMKSPDESRDPKLYCQFHEDIGHDTKNCRSLKRALDGLASKGHLKITYREMLTARERANTRRTSHLSHL